MTIHLRQNQPSKQYAQDGDASSSSLLYAASSTTASWKRSVAVLVMLVLAGAFFVFQFQDASKAQELEQDNKFKFEESKTTTTSSNNENHENHNDNMTSNDRGKPTTIDIQNHLRQQQDETEAETTPTPATPATSSSGSIRATATPDAVNTPPPPATTTTTTTTIKTENKKPFCTLDCTNLKQKRIAEFGGDLSNRQTMLALAVEARNKMVASIQLHYGDYFDAIFQHGFRPVSETGKSQQGLLRKLQIKALEVQTKFANEEALCQQDCASVLNPNYPLPFYHYRNYQTATAATAAAASQQQQQQQQHSNYYERYVWATGGHSASAGHGNLFNESYTAFLERDMKPLFRAIGVEFEGRNFAMGGTRSGLEIAMCFEQVFGTDLDFFAWDYGMTDGRKDSLLFHYGYRGALNPGRPAMLGVWTNGWKGRDERLLDLEQIGLPTFHRPTKSIDAMNAAFPDSGEMTEAQLQELPDYVRNFKCQGKIEKGDPYCQDDKYSKGICDNRASKAGWHPGIKQHGVDGHMLAMFLSDNLIKALQGLADHSNQDAESLLEELRAEEDELMDRIRSAHLGDEAWKIYDGGTKGGKLEDLDPDVNLKLFYKGKSICHTGRTPAITRFMGYLTNTDKVGGIAPYQSEQYDTGIEKNDADTTNADGQMRLVYEFNGKDRQQCEVPLRPDYKDFFYTHHRDGVVQLNFPNEKEKAAYKYKQSEMEGVVILILSECDWGKCKVGDLKHEDIEDGKVNIRINGVSVTKVVNIGSGCLVLKNKDGVKWEPSRNDDYEIAVDVVAPDSYLRISSVVIY